MCVQMALPRDSLSFATAIGMPSPRYLPSGFWFVDGTHPRNRGPMSWERDAGNSECDRRDIQRSIGWHDGGLERATD